jgi:predicted transcriptional regulator
VIPQGDSGSGKTTLARIVLTPFWDDVENYTRITGAGLEHKEESFDGKILFLEQFEGSQPGQLKYLMTGGKLTILVGDRDNSRVYKAAGLPVVVSTLVGAMIDSQLLNRASTLEIDESNLQTERIMRHKLECWTNVHGEDEKSALEQIKRIDDQCKVLGSIVREIKIPFAMQLEEGLPKVLSMRRGTDRFTSLVAAAAFLKAAMGLRPLVKLNGEEGRSIYVVALPEDLSDALYCLGDGFTDSLTYFLTRAKQIHEILQKNGGETSEDVSRELGLSQNRAREYLNHLVKLGYATKTKNKGTCTYKYEAHHTHPQIKLQATFTETDLKQWFQQQFPNNNAKLYPPEAKTGFESQPPVQVCMGFESDLGTAERTEQETGSDGKVVSDMGFEGGNKGAVPDGAA